MKQTLKTALFAASLALNALFATLALLVFLPADKAQTIGYFAMGDKAPGYLHSALILSVPAEGADVSFGPVEFLLEKGAAAALQLSVVRHGPNGKRAWQSNLALEPLYNPSVVSIRPSGYGLVVTGREAGETAVQIFSGGGFRDIARIVVYDPSALDD